MSNTNAVGLKNMGNSCYQNSVIQALYGAVPFKDFVISKSFRSMMNADNPNVSLALAFGNLLRQLSQSSTSSFISPDEFYNESIQVIDQITKYQQQDVSVDFLAPLLDKLHEATNKATDKSTDELPVKEDGQTDAEAAMLSRAAHQKNDDSIIKEIFSSQLKCTKRCTICGTSEIKFEESSLMTVPIPTKNDSNEAVSECTIYDCIRQFSTKEILNGSNVVECATCTTNMDATSHCRTVHEKVIEPFNTSPIVVISLNKFQYDINGNRSSKIETKVNFDIDNIIIAGVAHEVFATSNHHGGTGGGHYTAYVKNQSTGTWTNCNDKTCTPIDANDVVSGDNYLIFLKRKSDKWHHGE